MISTFGWIIILFFLLILSEIKDVWELKEKQEMEDECKKTKTIEMCQECTNTKCIYNRYLLN